MKRLLKRRLGILLGSVLVWQANVPPPLVRAEKIDQAQEVQQIRQIVLSRGNNPVALAHLVQLTKDLEPSVAAELFHQIADECIHAGQFDLAGDVLRQLIDQYLDQPAATRGLISLVRLYSSSEVAHLHRSASNTPDNKTVPIYALYLAQQALQRRRELADNPALAFQCAIASRLSGRSESAKSWLTPLKHNPRNQPWHQCALVESWLQGDRDEKPPKPVTRCLRTDERPRLDGVLDEQLWKAALPPAPTRSSTLQTSLTTDSTQINLAHDDEFLYLALRCKKFAQVAYVANNSPRSYDADLSEQDRVRLLLDLDRDYGTYFQFSVDHRGWTADSCWHDGSWNPRWFVAAGGDNTAWSVEAAIPWVELCPQAPPPSEAWAVAIERHLPGPSAPTRSKTPHAEVGPESFGLIIFE